MKYIICLKQVPDTKEIICDPITGSLLRDTVGSIPNPNDEDALCAVLDIREKIGGTISAITMGPKQSRATLRNALSLGVDYAYHMQDSRFSGSDVYVTAYTLAQGIKKIGLPDIIFCGKHSIDGDTGQVGAELAEILDYSHIYYVVEVNEITKDFIRVKAKVDNKIQDVKIELPAVISTDANAFPKKISSFRDKMLAQKKEIRVFKLEDLEDNNSYHYGYKASATKVKEMFAPSVNRKCQFLNDIDFKVFINKLLEEIKNEGKPEWIAKNKQDNYGLGEEIKLCVLIEEEGFSVGEEIIRNVIRFRDYKNINIDGIVVNSNKRKKILTKDYNLLDKLFIYNFNTHFLTTEHYIKAISEYIELDSEKEPDILLVGATALGRSFAPRLAAKYKTGITADCTEIDIDENNLLIQIRPAFGEELFAKIITPESKPQIATIRPGVMEDAFVNNYNKKVRIFSKEIELKNPRVRILSEELVEEIQNSLEDSEIVVIAGNAIKNKEDLEKIEKFAKGLNGALGVTRPLVQGGLANHTIQIGVSGRSLKNKIVILIGVSGSNQTLAGLKKVNKIIAINEDENARIFNYADIGIVKNWKELIL